MKVHLKFETDSVTDMIQAYVVSQNLKLSEKSLTKIVATLTKVLSEDYYEAETISKYVPPSTEISFNKDYNYFKETLPKQTFDHIDVSETFDIKKYLPQTYTSPNTTGTTTVNPKTTQTYTTAITAENMPSVVTTKSQFFSLLKTKVL